jgi:hypothetical protein
MTGPLRPVGDDTWRQPGRMTCAACGYTPDAFGYAEKNPDSPRAPQAGDWSVCFRCGEVAVIEVHPLLGAALREATTEELVEFAADPVNAATVWKLHRWRAGHGSGAQGN